VTGPVIDPQDFDALGVAAEVVHAVRITAIERGIDVVAEVSAPEGRHRLRMTGRPSGHTVLSVRWDELTRSRRNLVAEALGGRGWDVDEDGEGATRRYPPGTEAATVAFEALGVLTIAGAPPEPRAVHARDASGAEVPLA
jgi:hypothetical protein